MSTYMWCSTFKPLQVNVITVRNVQIPKLHVTSNPLWQNSTSANININYNDKIKLTKIYTRFSVAKRDLRKH